MDKYSQMIKLAVGIPVFVGTNSDYSLDIDGIKRAVTSKTKGILINTPNNPTGAVYFSKAINSLQGHTTSNSTTFVQWAGITALTECSTQVEQMRREFERRRNYMQECLASHPGIQCVKPGGAFYLMPDISSFFGKRYEKTVIEDSSDFCNYILEHAHVGIVPGSAFEMPDTVRFSYSTSMENIQRGMGRFMKALDQLR